MSDKTDDEAFRREAMLAEYGSLRSEVLVYLSRQEKRLSHVTTVTLALLGLAVWAGEPALAWVAAAFASVGWRGHGSLGDHMSRIATFIQRKYGDAMFEGRGWTGLYNADVNATRSGGEGTDLDAGVSAARSRDSFAKHVMKEVVSRTLPTLVVLSAAVALVLGAAVGFDAVQLVAAAFAAGHFGYAVYRQYTAEDRRRSLLRKLDSYLGPPTG